MRQMNWMVTKKMKILFSGNHSRNRISGRTALNSQNEMTPAMARLWVTASWYRSWRRITKNLSALKATMLKNEAYVRTLATTLYPLNTASWWSTRINEERILCRWQGDKCLVAALLNQHQGRRKTYWGAMFSEFFLVTKESFLARVLLKRLALRR